MRTLLSLPGLTALFLAAPLPAVTLVNDGFETTTHPDGIRTVPSGLGLPFYTRAVTGGVNLSITADATFNSNALSFDDTSADSQSEGIIAPLATAVNLDNTGDYLTLSFSFRYTNNGASVANAAAFRFGLFNSQGTAVTGDNQAASVNDTGYYVQVGAGTTAPASNNVFYEETGGTVPILGGVDRSVKTASGSGMTVNDNNIHTASFTLTRASATTMSLSLTVDGTTITASDGATLITSFDQIAWSNGFSATGLDFMLDDVVLTSNVPEPGPASLLLLAGTLSLLPRRRPAGPGVPRLFCRTRGPDEKRFPVV